MRGIFFFGFVRVGGGVVLWFRLIGVGFGDVVFECLFFWVWVYYWVFIWILMVCNFCVWGWYGGNCCCLGCYGGNCCCNCCCFVVKLFLSVFRWGYVVGIGRIFWNFCEILFFVIVRVGELWCLVFWVWLIGVGFGDVVFDCLVFWVWVYYWVYIWILMVFNLDCYGGKIVCYEFWMCFGLVVVVVEVVRVNWLLVVVLFVMILLFGFNYGYWNFCVL